MAENFPNVAKEEKLTDSRTELHSKKHKHKEIHIKIHHSQTFKN